MNARPGGGMGGEGGGGGSCWLLAAAGLRLAGAAAAGCWPLATVSRRRFDCRRCRCHGFTVCESKRGESVAAKAERPQECTIFSVKQACMQPSSTGT